MLAGWDIYSGAKSPEYVHAKEFGSQSRSSHHVIQLQQTGWGYQGSTSNVACVPLLFWWYSSPRSFSPRTRGSPKKAISVSQVCTGKAAFFSALWVQRQGSEVGAARPFSLGDQGRRSKQRSSMPLGSLSPLCSSPVSCSAIFSVPVSWHSC